MRLIFAFSLVIGLLACTNNSSVIQGEDLNGKWEVTEAKRNGKLTRTFSNAYFQFAENGDMETNYSGELLTGPYEIQENEIIHASPQVQVYNVDEWVDSSFLMNFEYQGFKFEFLLKRIEE